MSVHRVAPITEDESTILEYYPSYSLQEYVMSSNIFFDPVRAGSSFQTSSYMNEAEVSEPISVTTIPFAGTVRLAMSAIFCILAIW